MITSIEQLDLTKAYTFKDYLSWRFEAGGVPQRVELLRGYIFHKSKSNSNIQKVIGSKLFDVLCRFSNNRNCKIFVVSFVVYLPSINGKGETVVQPDLCVVYDRSKVESENYVGFPDLIIEILPLGNSRKAMNQKFQIYEEAGVKE